MGLHGSPTCELQFENSFAYLIGEENQGYKYMLRLMNNARIGVAFQKVLDLCKLAWVKLKHILNKEVHGVKKFLVTP